MLTPTRSPSHQGLVIGLLRRHHFSPEQFSPTSQRVASTFFASGGSVGSSTSLYQLAYFRLGSGPYRVRPLLYCVALTTYKPSSPPHRERGRPEWHQGDLFLLSSCWQRSLRRTEADGQPESWDLTVMSLCCGTAGAV